MKYVLPLLLIAFSGFAAEPPVVKSKAAKELLKHPEFKKAMEAAPEFTKAVLKELDKHAPEPLSKETKLLLELAESGDAKAQYKIGDMLHTGEGVSSDYKEAAKWYRKAAEQGHLLAQYYLGGMYKDGEGVTRDLTEAAKWYSKAAEQGDKDALKRLEALGVSADFPVKPIAPVKPIDPNVVMRMNKGVPVYNIRNDDWPRHATKFFDAWSLDQIKRIYTHQGNIKYEVRDIGPEKINGKDAICVTPPSFTNKEGINANFFDPILREHLGPLTFYLSNDDGKVVAIYHPARKIKTKHDSKFFITPHGKKLGYK